MNEDDGVEPENEDGVEPENEGEREEPESEGESEEPTPGAEIEAFKVFGGGTGFKGVGLEGTGFKGVNMERFAGFSAGIGALLGGSDVFKNMQTNLLGIGDSLSKMYASALMPSFDSISALARYMAEAPALTRPSDYAVLDAPESAYSPHMKSPQSYFQATEEVISDFDDLHAAITTLISKTPDLPLVWRGVRNADWGMHSHLYRHLMTTNQVVPPQKNPTKAQPYPDEDQMVAAEREILHIARSDWRFDNMSALETFARIQHAGGPTRLIDVTKNPYIGAWFAVEFDKDEEDNDARLFALATRPVAQEGKPPAPHSALQLDNLGASRDPFWHLLTDNANRQKLDWGTGARRRIWVPPAYDPRISAQNAAFVLDGVPMTSNKLASYFTVEKNVYWRRADLLASASIYAKMLKPTRKPMYNSRNFAPTFSFRIEAGAKEKIRDVMESRFGYRLSYIYPDMAALAEHLKRRPLNG